MDKMAYITTISLTQSITQETSSIIDQSLNQITFYYVSISGKFQFFHPVVWLQIKRLLPPLLTHLVFACVCHGTVSHVTIPCQVSCVDDRCAVTQTRSIW